MQPLLPAETQPTDDSLALSVVVPLYDEQASLAELTGRLLPVGGVKEKVLAAHRNRIHHVLLPEGNRKDLEELPREVRSATRFSFADATLAALLELFPTPRARGSARGEPTDPVNAADPPADCAS